MGIFNSITLHAISNEPVKCIYIMLDVHIDYPQSAANGQLPANNNGNHDEQMAQDNGDIDGDDDDEGTCEGKNRHYSFSLFVPTNYMTNFFSGR